MFENDIGAYAYFKVTGLKSLNAFFDKFTEKIEADEVDVEAETWWPLLHYRKLFERSRDGSYLDIMAKLQRADVVNFLRTMRETDQSDPPVLQMYPVVIKRTDKDGNPGDPELNVMAHKQTQTRAFRTIQPSQFRTSYQNQKWTYDGTGFWFSMFLTKRNAKSWLKSAAKKLDAAGFELESYENNVKVVNEMTIRKIIKDKLNLTGDAMTTPWDNKRWEG